MSDKQLRQLERQYGANPCEETQQAYHAALLRTGVCNGEKPLAKFKDNFANYIGHRVITFLVILPNNQCPLCKTQQLSVRLRYGHYGQYPINIATLAGCGYSDATQGNLANSGKLPKIRSENNTVIINPVDSEEPREYYLWWDIIEDAVVACNTVIEYEF